MLLAADLELDIVRLLVLLDPRGCNYRYVSISTPSIFLSPRRDIGVFDFHVEAGARNVQEASLRRQISMNCGGKDVNINFISFQEKTMFQRRG